MVMNPKNLIKYQKYWTVQPSNESACYASPFEIHSPREVIYIGEQKPNLHVFAASLDDDDENSRYLLPDLDVRSRLFTKKRYADIYYIHAEFDEIRERLSRLEVYILQNKPKDLWDVHNAVSEAMAALELEVRTEDE